MASEVSKTPEFVESEMHEQPIVDNEQYIVRVRKYLLVLLSIQWVSSLPPLADSFVDVSPAQFIFFFILVVGIYSTTPIPKGEILDELLWWTPMMTVVLYYTIGLLAAYTYHRTALFIVSNCIVQYRYTRRSPFGTLVRHNWS